MTVTRAARARPSRSPPARASPTATPGPPPQPTTRRAGPARVRRRRAAPRRQRRRGLGRRQAAPGPRPDLHGPVRRRPRGRRGRRAGDEVVLFGPGDDGRADRRRTGPRPAAPSLRDRHPDRRPAARAATPTRRRPHERHTQGPGRRRPARSASPRPAPRCASPSAARSSRAAGPATHTPFGSLRSPADHGRRRRRRPPPRRGRRVRPGPGTARGARRGAAELTVVFVPRLRAQPRLAGTSSGPAYRGLVRTVYYDQRSHGRSGRSTHGPRDHRAARPRPQAGPRRSRARGPDRAGRPLDGRDDDHGAGRAAPRAVRRPRRRASA